MKKTFCEFLRLMRVHKYGGRTSNKERSTYRASQPLVRRVRSFEPWRVHTEVPALVVKRAMTGSGCEYAACAASRDDCVILRGSDVTPKYMFHLLQSSTSANYLVSI